jgi:hypothetical protein
MIAMGPVVAQAGNEPGPPANLVITEFMADNASSLRDEDGDYSDWIEIYNASATLQTLDGWSLTDEVNVPGKWAFPPGVQIPAASYRIVFASGKDRTNAARPHTNFKLSGGGEYLALIDPLGAVASEFSPAYPRQHEDVSYGRDAGDFSLLLYFPIATPGARNASGGAGFAPEVQFSRASGTFPSGQNLVLTLSSPSSNATIYYTLGTNVPGTGTLRYTNAISIRNSAIVRARAFAPGLLPGPISSRTFLALAPDVLGFTSDLPILILHNFGQGAVLATGEEQYVAMQSFEPVFREGSGPRSTLTNAPTQAERGHFHVRGFLTAVTSTNGKSSFLLEIQDEFGTDKDLALLGLPEESDWVLYAPNEWDRALFQNPMAHQLLREFGTYSSRTRFFELFLKDDAGAAGPITLADYYGLFVLEERIKRDPNRVDVEPLQPEHTSASEVTGGYIFSIDEPNGEPQLNAGGATLNWEYPGGSEMTNALRAPQLNYIRNYFNQFNSALHGANWTDPRLGYAAYIGVNSWIDYHLHCVLTFSPDVLRLSTYLYKPRNQPLKFGPGWDFDRSQGSADMRDFNPLVWRSSLGSDYFNESPWWFKLFQDPDFWQRWIDRYQELREGVLSTNHLFGLIDGFAAQVREAQPREQARWNIPPRTGLTNSGGFTYDFGSAPGYDNEVRFKKHWYSLRLGFMDTQFLARPRFTSTGGLVAAGFPVAVLPAAKPGSAVLCTLDGSDPRLPGGGISPLALSNLGPLTLGITNPVRLVARSYHPGHRNLVGPNNPPLSSPWSGPITLLCYTQVPPLRITEIMYHPADPPTGNTNSDEAFEFIEVKNISSNPLNVHRFRLGGGIEFEFPDAILAAGELAVVVANADAFRSRYPWGPRVLGVYAGRLDNAGQRLVLTGPLGEPILDFRYDDDWHPITDGLGFSLVHLDARAPSDTWNLKSHWRPSALPDAFPAAEDPRPSVFPSVVINEVRTSPSDAIELHNGSALPADISGWFLTDDFRNPKKFQIPPGTVLAPGEFKVFEEPNLPFALSSGGEEAWLLSSDEGELTGYMHGFDFGPVEIGATHGRYVTSTGTEQFPEQSGGTLGSANPGPRVGPVVITEIHYHPPDFVFGTNTVDNGGDEYVELFNVTEAAVPLHNPDVPTHAWRLTDAVRFTFPPGQHLSPGGFALVVAFDPGHAGQAQSFRDRHGVPPEVPLYGPFEGKLDNSSDRVELRRPLPPGSASAEDVPYSLVERISYSDEPPWPTGADGLGRALHRIDAVGFGNDANNWAAAEPSPGRRFSSGLAPAIIAQPGDVTVSAGATTLLSVTAAGGDSLSFQWRLDGRALPGATTSTLLLENIQPTQAGEYDVVVMNHANSATSDKARLTVLVPPRIVLQPQTQAVNAGAPAHFSVVAAGTQPLNHQWRLNGVPLPGETGPVLTFSNVVDLHQGIYDVAITDALGSVFSSNAMLMVKAKPTVLAPLPPLNLVVASNETVTLGVELHGTFPMWVRWRLFKPAGSQILEDQILPSPGPLPLMVTQATTYLVFSALNSAGAYAVIATNAASPLQTAFTNAHLTVLADSDGDRLPDDYEARNGLRSDDPSDATEDLDGDRVSNRDEYLAGTDPRDQDSFLRLNVVQAGSGLMLAFGARSNRTYTLQYAEHLRSVEWRRLADVPARATNRVETMGEPPLGTNRYYRVITPRQR